MLYEMACLHIEDAHYSAGAACVPHLQGSMGASQQSC